MVTAMNQFDSWENELYHHGIKGQKWGVRNYQNADGTLTELGKRRYGEGSVSTGKERAKFLNKLDSQRARYMASASQTKNVAKKEQFLKSASATERTIQSVLNAAKKDKTPIQSKTVTRSVMTGKDKAKSIAMSVLASGLVTGGSYLSAVGTAKAMAAKSALGIGVGSYGVYAVPTFVTSKVRGTKYKADDRYR